MELLIDTIRSHYHGCYGCQRFNRDVMISFTYEGDPERNKVHDLFLTQEQAEHLYDCLSKTLQLNRDEQP